MEEKLNSRRCLFTNADLIRSADTEIEMVDIILKLVKKIPEGEDKRRTLYQLLMQEADNG